jgi:hypothetical protein
LWNWPPAAPPLSMKIEDGGKKATIPWCSSATAAAAPPPAGRHENITTTRALKECLLSHTSTHPPTQSGRSFQHKTLIPQVLDPSFSEYKRGELSLTSSYNPLRKKASSTTGRHILRNLWQDPSPPIYTPYTHPKRSPPPTFLRKNLFTKLRSSQAWNDASSTTNERLRNLLSKTKTSFCSPFSLSLLLLLLLLLFYSWAEQNTEPVCKLDSEPGKKWDLKKKIAKRGN